MGLSRPVRLTNKADDIYSDYLEILVGLRYDATKIKWRLDSAAKFAEYQSWESHMERGFAQCHARDSKFGGPTEFLLAHRRVDAQVVTWWREERCAKGITLGTCEETSAQPPGLWKRKEIKQGSNEDKICDEDTEKNEGPRLLQIG
jgi:hypothetical protein